MDKGERSTPNRLRELRTRRGLTLDRLAGEVGISKSLLWDLETGRRRFHDDHIMALTAYFGVTADYLLGRDAAGAPWWERDEAPTDVELEEFIKAHGNLKLAGEPLNEQAKERVLFFLRMCHQQMVEERNRAARAGKRDGR